MLKIDVSIVQLFCCCKAKSKSIQSSNAILANKAEVYSLTMTAMIIKMTTIKITHICKIKSSEAQNEITKVTTRQREMIYKKLNQNLYQEVLSS